LHEARLRSEYSEAEILESADFLFDEDHNIAELEEEEKNALLKESMIAQRELA
jgi:hypothetical protein